MSSDIQDKHKPRHLADVSRDELIAAVAAMCQQLHISGSLTGDYDLYAAVGAEWEKVKRSQGGVIEFWNLGEGQ